MKKRIVPMVVAAIALALSPIYAQKSGGGASSSQDPSKPALQGSEYRYIDTVPGSYLNFACMSDPKTFGPWDGGGGGRNMVNMSAYESLARMRGDGSMSNCIMKSYTKASSGVYKITIYDSVYDSAGNHIMASDVAFSVGQCAKFGNWVMYTAAVKSVKAQGNYVVELTLDNERPDTFTGVLENVMIVSEKAYKDSPNGMASSPVGTGAYVLERYVPGSSMTFVVNKKYWQKDPALVSTLSLHNIERYTVNFINEKSQHSIAMETGKVDCSNSVLSVDYSNFLEKDGQTAKKGFSYLESQKQGMTCLIYNCASTDICGDVNLRKAIAYAIDRKALAYAAYGKAGIACDSFSQTTHFDYDKMYVPEGGYFPCNKDIAKSYLAKSGYKGQQIVLYSQADSEVTTQCQLIKSYCEAIGIHVKVEAYDTALFSNYLHDSNPKWDMAFTFCRGGDYTYISVASLIDLSFYKNGLNNLQIHDQKLQDLFEKAVKMDTFSKKNTTALLDYITDNCYMIALTNYNQKVFYNSKTISLLGTTKTGFDPVPGACIPAAKGSGAR